MNLKNKIKFKQKFKIINLMICNGKFDEKIGLSGETHIIEFKKNNITLKNLINNNTIQLNQFNHFKRHISSYDICFFQFNYKPIAFDPKINKILRMISNLDIPICYIEIEKDLRKIYDSNYIEIIMNISDYIESEYNFQNIFTHLNNIRPSFHLYSYINLINQSFLVNKEYIVQFEKYNRYMNLKEYFRMMKYLPKLNMNIFNLESKYLDFINIDKYLNVSNINFFNEKISNLNILKYGKYFIDFKDYKYFSLDYIFILKFLFGIVIIDKRLSRHIDTFLSRHCMRYHNKKLNKYTKLFLEKNKQYEDIDNYNKQRIVQINAVFNKFYKPFIKKIETVLLNHTKNKKDFNKIMKLNFINDYNINNYIEFKNKVGV